jgi:chemotaxis protein histidine kinase CheA
MIGLALIQQTIAAIDADIKTKQEEKEALLSIGKELDPFLTKIKVLCRKIPSYQEDILNLIASELNIDTTKKTTKKQKQSIAKEPPFKIGDYVRVISGEDLGKSFKITKIKSRGVGWQIFDNEGNYYRSSAVTVVTQVEEQEKNEEQVEEQTGENQAKIWPIPKGTIVRQKTGEDTTSEGEVVEYDPVEKQAEEQVEKQVEKQVEEQVEEQVKEQAEEQVEKQVEEQAEEQVKKQVEEQVEEQAEEQVKKQVEEQAEEQVKKQVEEQAAESIIKKAIATLNAADWKPAYIDFNASNNATMDGRLAIVVTQDWKPKGFIYGNEKGEFVIGSELVDYPHLKAIKKSLSEVAPIYEKQPEEPLKEGINPGRGIKSEIHTFSHEDLMKGQLNWSYYSLPNMIDFAKTAGIQKKDIKKTRKQIAEQICKVYQSAN